MLGDRLGSERDKYPQPISTWPSIPENIGSAFTEERTGPISSRKIPTYFRLDDDGTTVVQFYSVGRDWFSRSG